MARPKPTDPVIVAPWTATVILKRGQDKHGRYYWRARGRDLEGNRYTHTARAHRSEVAAWLKSLPAPGAEIEEEPEEDISTVLDLLELYSGAVKEDPSIQWRTKESRINACKRLARVLGGESIQALRKGLLDSYAQGKGKASKYASGTRRFDLDIARKAWRWAAERDMLQGILPRVKLPKLKPAYSQHTPTPGEVAAVVQWLETAALLHHARTVRVLFATGARVAEVCRLTWADVDLAASPPTATLKGKTGARTIALPVAAVKVLKELEPGKPRDKVLGSTPDSLRHAIKDACKAEDIPHWSPHGLRRAMVDKLYTRGTEIGAAAAFLGHSPETAMAHYRKATAADQATSLPRDLGELPGGEVVELDPVLGHNSGDQASLTPSHPNNSHFTIKSVIGDSYSSSRSSQG
jgi:integrase